jgi:anthranilate 1,2-dioxygenase small subunit
MSASASDMVSLRERVEALQTAYAYRLDDLDIDAWPNFFTKTGRYVVTTRENVQASRPIGIINCVNRGMMQDRVKAFHTANIFEPHRYNHMLGPAEILERSADQCRVRSNFQVVRIMEHGRMDFYAAGSYYDSISIEEAGLRFQERKVVLDSCSVDILMIIPL